MDCLTTLKHRHEFSDLSLSRLGLFDRADTVQDRVSISAARRFEEGSGDVPIPTKVQRTKKSSLVDHIVGSGEQCLRNCEAEVSFIKGEARNAPRRRDHRRD
jgi:hypothetical protein